MTTYRYYSAGKRDGAWVILGWSRTAEAALARPGTQYTAYAGDRRQAAQQIRRDFRIAIGEQKTPGARAGR